MCLIGVSLTAGASCSFSAEVHDLFCGELARERIMARTQQEPVVTQFCFACLNLLD